MATRKYLVGKYEEYYNSFQGENAASNKASAYITELTNMVTEFNNISQTMVYFSGETKDAMTNEAINQIMEEFKLTQQNLQETLGPSCEVIDYISSALNEMKIKEDDYLQKQYELERLEKELNSLGGKWNTTETSEKQQSDIERHNKAVEQKENEIEAKEEEINTLEKELDLLKENIDLAIEKIEGFESQLKDFSNYMSLTGTVFGINGANEFSGYSLEEKLNYIQTIIDNYDTIYKSLNDLYEKQYGKGFTFSREDFNNLDLIFDAFDLYWMAGVNKDSLKTSSYNENVLLNIEKLTKIIGYCNTSGVIEKIGKYIDGASWIDSGLQDFYWENSPNIMKINVFGENDLKQRLKNNYGVSESEVRNFLKGKFEVFRGSFENLKTSYGEYQNLATVMSVIKEKMNNLNTAKKILPFEAETLNSDFQDYLNKNYDGYRYLNADKMSVMSQKEIALYDYLYHNKSKQEADKYLGALENAINQRIGAKNAAQYIEWIKEDGFTVGDLFRTGGEGLKDGVRGFGEGLGKLFTAWAIEEGEKSALDYELMYKTQYMQRLMNDPSFIDQETNKNWMGLTDLTAWYNTGSSIGNMVIPSIVGMIPGGQPLSSILFGMSIAGNTAAEAKSSGYSTAQAYLYGGLTGLSEAVTEKMLGGIQGLSEKALGRNILTNMFNEGLEEFVQEPLDRLTRMAILHEEMDFSHEGLQELLNTGIQSFKFGALSAGIMQGSTGVVTKGLDIATKIASPVLLNSEGKAVVNPLTGKNVKKYTSFAQFSQNIESKRAIKGANSAIDNALSKINNGETLSLSEKINLNKKIDNLSVEELSKINKKLSQEQQEIIKRAVDGIPTKSKDTLAKIDLSEKINQINEAKDSLKNIEFNEDDFKDAVTRDGRTLADYIVEKKADALDTTTRDNIEKASPKVLKDIDKIIEKNEKYAEKLAQKQQKQIEKMISKQEKANQEQKESIKDKIISKVRDAVTSPAYAEEEINNSHELSDSELEKVQAGVPNVNNNRTTTNVQNRSTQNERIESNQQNSEELSDNELENVRGGIPNVVNTTTTTNVENRTKQDVDHSTKNQQEVVAASTAVMSSNIALMQELSKNNEQNNNKSQELSDSELEKVQAGVPNIGYSATTTNVANRVSQSSLQELSDSDLEKAQAGVPNIGYNTTTNATNKINQTESTQTKQDNKDVLFNEFEALNKNQTSFTTNEVETQKQDSSKLVEEFLKSKFDLSKSYFNIQEVLNQKGQYYKNIQNLYKEYLDIAPDAKQQQVVADILFNGSYGNLQFDTNKSINNNAEMEIYRRLSMAALYLANPDTFNSLVDMNVNVFHGTNSSSLGSILENGLMSGKVQEQNDKKVTTGEWSRIGGFGGVQRSFISFSDIFDMASRYAKSGDDGSFEIIVGTSKDNITDLIDSGMSSGLPEIGIAGRFPADRIKTLIVPGDKVPLVQKMVGNKNIKVLSLDGYKEGNVGFYYNDGDINVSPDSVEILKDIVKKRVEQNTNTQESNKRKRNIYEVEEEAKNMEVKSFEDIKKLNELSKEASDLMMTEVRAIDVSVGISERVFDSIYKQTFTEEDFSKMSDDDLKLILKNELSEESKKAFTRMLENETFKARVDNITSQSETSQVAQNNSEELSDDELENIRGGIPNIGYNTVSNDENITNTQESNGRKRNIYEIEEEAENMEVKSFEDIKKLNELSKAAKDLMMTEERAIDVSVGISEKVFESMYKLTFTEEDFRNMSDSDLKIIIKNELSEESKEVFSRMLENETFENKIMSLITSDPNLSINENIANMLNLQKVVNNYFSLKDRISISLDTIYNNSNVIVPYEVFEDYTKEHGNIIGPITNYTNSIENLAKFLKSNIETKYTINIGCIDDYTDLGTNIGALYYEYGIDADVSCQLYKNNNFNTVVLSTKDFEYNEDSIIESIKELKARASKKTYNFTDLFIDESNYIDLRHFYVTDRIRQVIIETIQNNSQINYTINSIDYYKIFDDNTPKLANVSINDIKPIINNILSSNTVNEDFMKSLNTLNNMLKEDSSVAFQINENVQKKILDLVSVNEIVSDYYDIIALNTFSKEKLKDKILKMNSKECSSLLSYTTTEKLRNILDCISINEDIHKPIYEKIISLLEKPTFFNKLKEVIIMYPELQIANCIYCHVIDNMNVGELIDNYNAIKNKLQDSTVAIDKIINFDGDVPESIIMDIAFYESDIKNNDGTTTKYNLFTNLINLSPKGIERIANIINSRENFGIDFTYRKDKNNLINKIKNDNAILLVKNNNGEINFASFNAMLLVKNNNGEINFASFSEYQKEINYIYKDELLLNLDPKNVTRYINLVDNVIDFKESIYGDFSTDKNYQRVIDTLNNPEFKSLLNEMSSKEIKKLLNLGVQKDSIFDLALNGDRTDLIDLVLSEDALTMEESTLINYSRTYNDITKTKVAGVDGDRVRYTTRINPSILTKQAIERINEYVKQNPNITLALDFKSTKGLTLSNLYDLNENILIKIEGDLTTDYYENKQNNYTMCSNYFGSQFISSVYTRNEAYAIISKMEEIEEYLDLSWNEKEKAIYIYDILKDMIKYDAIKCNLEDIMLEQNRNIESYTSDSTRSLRGLISGNAVCAGYAIIFQEMLTRQGIKAYYDSGISRTGGHAWNVVILDGKNYLCDLTWDSNSVTTTLYEFNKAPEEFYKFHIHDVSTHIPQEIYENISTMTIEEIDEIRNTKTEITPVMPMDAESIEYANELENLRRKDIITDNVLTTNDRYEELTNKYLSELLEVISKSITIDNTAKNNSVTIRANENIFDGNNSLYKQMILSKCIESICQKMHCSETDAIKIIESSAYSENFEFLPVNDKLKALISNYSYDDIIGAIVEKNNIEDVTDNDIATVEYGINKLMEKNNSTRENAINQIKDMLLIENYNFMTSFGDARQRFKELGFKKIQATLNKIEMHDIEVVEYGISKYMEKYNSTRLDAINQITGAINTQDYSYITSNGNARQIFKSLGFERISIALKNIMNQDKPNFDRIGSSTTSTYGVNQGLFYKMFIFTDVETGKTYNYVEVKKRIAEAIRRNEVIPQFYKDAVSNEYLEFKDKVMKKYYLSDRDASMIIEAIDDSGACSYASVCNEIFSRFLGNEQEFLYRFGFPMYTIVDGKSTLNSKELLFDLFLYANTTENGGKLIIKSGNSYRVNIDLFSTKLDPLGRVTIDSQQKEYLSSFVGKNVFLIDKYLNTKGLTYESQTIKMMSYIINNQDIENIKNRVREGINNGLMYSLGIYTSGYPIELRSADWEEYNSDSTANWGIGGHSVFITGVNYGGFTVSSWGRKYIIPFSDLVRSASWVLTESKIIDGVNITK